MTHPVAVILVVGLNRSLIGEHSPRIKAFADQGTMRQLKPVLPAVTCSVQSSMLTGRLPGGEQGHGIVGNGYYDRESAEVRFWKQSNHLVGGPKVWEAARERDPTVTCANLFWWFNMYSSVDYSVTPRPMYKADGRKLPDVYTEPSGLRDELQGELGTFPLFNFWGPGSSIRSSQWIADAAVHVHQCHRPTLTLVYLPHLDYALQKVGPGHVEADVAVREIDGVVGQLLDYFAGQGVRVVIASEYGIEPVDRAVAINRVLREAGGVRVREEQGRELLDAGASEAFAVADHQIAHVYVKDRERVDRFAGICRQTQGVERVLARAEQAEAGIDHARSGDLVLVAEQGYWFSYAYWLDDGCEPDFARTVDIHRKPGYDPLELFIDPEITFPKAQIAWKLLKRKMGFRTLLDVIPLDTSLVRGSHGRVDQAAGVSPVLITQGDYADRADTVGCEEVYSVILEQMFSGS